MAPDCQCVANRVRYTLWTMPVFTLVSCWDPTAVVLAPTGIFSLLHSVCPRWHSVGGLC